MKKALLTLTLGCLLGTSAFAHQIIIEIQGSGGVEPDGTFDMVCPDQAPEDCAVIIINIPESEGEDKLILDYGMVTEQQFNIDNIHFIPPAELDEESSIQVMEGSLVRFNLMP